MAMTEQITYITNTVMENDYRGTSHRGENILKYVSNKSNHFNMSNYVIKASNHVMFSAFEMKDVNGVSKSIFKENDDGTHTCTLCYTKVYPKYDNPNGRNMMYNVENDVKHRKSRVDFRTKKIMWTCSVPETPKKKIKKVKRTGHMKPKDDGGGLWIDGEMI